MGGMRVFIHFALWWTIGQALPSDEKLPAGNVSVKLSVDAHAICRARPLLPAFHYNVSTWRNGAVGFDDPLAIYGLDDLSKDVGTPSKLKYAKQTLVAGEYKVSGNEPILYVCAFSPSEGSPIPIFKDWRMCGCCYQFNAERAVNFISDCQDSKGTCQDYCVVHASGTAANRTY